MSPPAPATDPGPDPAPDPGSGGPGGRKAPSLRLRLGLWLGGAITLAWLGAAAWSLIALSQSLHQDFDLRLKAAVERLMPLAVVQIFEREDDGTKSDDTLFGTAKGDRIKGKAGDDVLFGGAGDDELVGGSGAHIITGGTGDDRIWGDAASPGFAANHPAGADVFVFAPGDGNDVFHNFDNGLDVIRIAASAGAASLADLTITTATDPVNVLIQYGPGGDSIELVSLSLADIDASDFPFL